MLDPQFVPHAVNALIFAALGLIVFVAGFVVIDWWTPYDLWKEIVEEKNTALAIMVAGISLGLSLIIAAAIHG
ncbi:MAG: DUF350 domain-containing protein [Candidatus Wallbacteria bacterium]|nr:DUF350 domain-containing protein [Candidatus Wallbacteria bacterium]